MSISELVCESENNQLKTNDVENIMNWKRMLLDFEFYFLSKNVGHDPEG